MMTGPCEAHGERGKCIEQGRERGCGEKGEEGETGQIREREQERAASDGSSETWRLLQGSKMWQTRPSKLTVSHLSQSAKHSHSPCSGLM